MEISESTDQAATSRGREPVPAPDLSDCAEEVRDRWFAAVNTGIPAIASGNTPALGAFLPVLFDNIAEAIAPHRGRPFGTGAACVLSDLLWTDAHMNVCNTDAVLKELQIFRSVFFSVVKCRARGLSDYQCQRMGDLIDLAMRDAMTVCAVRDRAMRESVISEFSHDLRNPLNVASALAQLIQRRPDSEKVTMMAARIHAKIAETDAMIQAHVDMLDGK